MPVFKVKIANYFGTGNVKTIYSDGGWSLNKIEAKLGKYKIELIQSRDVIGNKIPIQGFVYTTDLHINGVIKKEEGKSISIDLCRLLSLASFSQVVPFSFEFQGVKNSPSVMAEAMFFRPLIDIQNGGIVHQFIEKTWSKYRKYKKSRKLGEVIEMMTVAELTVQPLEVKLAQIFIVMENLKATYAKQQGYPFVKGAYRKMTNPSKPIEKQPSLGFEKLLTEMFREVGMSPNLKRIISLRNEIIHFGLSRKPYSSLRKDYDFCHDVVREYLLRFLGYEGEYLLYSLASRKAMDLNLAKKSKSVRSKNSL